MGKNSGADLKHMRLYPGPTTFHPLRASTRGAKVRLLLVVAMTLDVGCGTLDTLVREIRVDREVSRSPHIWCTFVVGDALEFESLLRWVFTSNVYGLLREPERASFLSEVRRVGHELVLGEPTLRSRPMDGPRDSRSASSDGSATRSTAATSTPRGLAKELGGQILFAGEWFSVVVARA